MEIRIPEVTLNDGLSLPVIGFGTYPLKGNDGVNAIVSAINYGYRLIDSAYNYENEGTVGKLFAAVLYQDMNYSLRPNFQAAIRNTTKQ